MATGLASWSKTAATNATADSTVGMAEGMAPSAVNDGVRALMASAAKWRDDVSGALTTGGTSTAFTLTTNQVFASLAAMNAQIITIVPHTTSGADPTLAVDGLTAKQIRTATGVNVPSGTLVQGTPYQLVYFSSAGEFIMMNFNADPYIIPIGAMLPYCGTTAPNSSFVLPYGQAVSRTTYATYFAQVSTTFGVGDGSTTFNVPDLRGRVLAGKDDMGGTSANRLTNQTGGLNGDTLGATGGAETHTLTQAQLPNVSPTFTGGSNAVSVTSTSALIPTNSARLSSYSGGGITAIDSSVVGAVTSTGNVTPTGTISALGSGTAHNNCQPTIILNYILRII